MTGLVERIRVGRELAQRPERLCRHERQREEQLARVLNAPANLVAALLLLDLPRGPAEAAKRGDGEDREEQKDDWHEDHDAERGAEGALLWRRGSMPIRRLQDPALFATLTRFACVSAFDTDAIR